jgi:hypothetical protein
MTEAGPLVKEIMTKFVVEFAASAAKQLIGGCGRRAEPFARQVRWVISATPGASAIW